MDIGSCHGLVTLKLILMNLMKISLEFSMLAQTRIQINVQVQKNSWKFLMMRAMKKMLLIIELHYIAFYLKNELQKVIINTINLLVQ